VAAPLWYKQSDMRTQLRIVAGTLRGRKLTCHVNPKVRPIPEMVREALFSILGDAVPERHFYDLFAGTGAVGLEALSRGARAVDFVERDFRVAAAIEQHLLEFEVTDRGTVVRADAYRWAEHWLGSAEPVNLFLGPPYPDFERRMPDLMALLASLQAKAAGGSVLVLQSERTLDSGELPGSASWDLRCYGRNQLSIWVKEK
jgi:16S rRNA (guanine(966)-N(2))-methyltransferase RsmD